MKSHPERQGRDEDDEDDKNGDGDDNDDDDDDVEDYYLFNYLCLFILVHFKVKKWPIKVVKLQFL